MATTFSADLAAPAATLIYPRRPAPARARTCAGCARRCHRHASTPWRRASGPPPLPKNRASRPARYRRSAAAHCNRNRPPGAAHDGGTAAHHLAAVSGVGQAGLEHARAFAGAGAFDQVQEIVRLQRLKMRRATQYRDAALLQLIEIVDVEGAVARHEDKALYV